MASCRSTPRNRVEWVRGEQQHVPRPRARARAATSSTRSASTAPLRGRVAARHDDPRPQLPASCPRRTSALRALGMRVLVPAAARRSRRIIVDARVDARGPRRAARRAARRRSTSCRWASTGRPAVDADARGRAARAARARRPRRSCSRCRRKRPHKNLLRAARRARRDRRRAPPGARRCPATRRRTSDELRARAARARRRRRRAASRLAARSADLEGLYALAARVRLPVALRGLRAAGARGDGARRAGRHAPTRSLAAGGRGRRGAARRPADARTRSRRRSSALLGDGALRARCAPRARTGRALLLGAHGGS